MSEQQLEETAREGNGATQPQHARSEAPVETGKKSRTWLAVGLGLGALALVGLLWWLHARKFEDTDDAQVDGYISSISPRVPGTVMRVLVEDNQSVHPGDLLVEMDTADLEVAVAQARASVAQAEAAVAAEQPTVSITATSNRTAVQVAEDEVANARADLEAAQRDLEQAEANDRFAQQQRQRAAQLLASQTIPQAEFDQRVTAAEVTRAAVAAARKHVEQRVARLQTAQARLAEARANAPRQLVSREAGLSVRQANLELARAQLQLLRLQLEPHFLFNTLHAISTLVRKDPEGAERTIAQLSDLLRLTLDTLGRQKSTVKEEMEFVERYVAIQQTRFGDRFESRGRA